MDSRHWASLAAFLKEALGERYEVVLRDAHDVRHAFAVRDRVLVDHVEACDAESSQIGLLQDILNSGALQQQQYFCTCGIQEDGRRTAKTSVYFIRADRDAEQDAADRDAADRDAADKDVETGGAQSDEPGDIAAFLCIHEKPQIDITVREVFEEMTKPEGASESMASEHSKLVNREIDALLAERIEAVWARYNKPDARAKKADKLDFVRELFEMGVFRMRGAAQQVSKISGISQASLYRYLGTVIEE